MNNVKKQELTAEQKLSIAEDFKKWSGGGKLAESNLDVRRKYLLYAVGYLGDAGRKWVLEVGDMTLVEQDNPDGAKSKTVLGFRRLKCGNADMGVYLLDDIMARLNERHLNGSIAKITSIKSDGHTWITITVEFPREFNKDLMDNTSAYVEGMVAGILVWSGVEVV